MSNFDTLADWYDRLAKLVFGKTIQNAQLNFFPALPANAHILVLGGGTGWIIPEILKHSSKCQICYIDASAKMIAKCKDIYQGPQIDYIVGTEHNIPPGVNFEVVITCFYLDLFTDKYLQEVIQLIRSSLQPRALWMVSDFVNRNFVHRLLLWFMYRFFRFTCKLKTSSLPDWENALSNAGLDLTAHKLFYHGFILSALYHTNPE